MPHRGGLELLEAMRADPRTAALPFVLLCLFGAEHDSGNWAHHPDAIGQKPMRAVALADLVNKVLTGNMPRNIVTTRGAAPANEDFRGARILLVEDNPVNQRVAQHILQKLSAEVTLANNGAEALERLAEGSYDAVLMDCQMPVMDGMSATKRIRDQERAAGAGKHLPIIALTANVMGSDRADCIVAGMDAHLGKPIDPAQLTDCLSRYLKKEAAAPAVNLEAVRELTGGDLEFQRELFETFISSGDRNLADIIEALRLRDYDTIGKRAHALKGASANIHARELSSTASALESAAKQNSGADIDGLVLELGEKLRMVNAELRKAG
jgi:two-component system sensor histidine kinase/response regulator